jgi:hypothetical protein
LATVVTPPDDNDELLQQAQSQWNTLFNKHNEEEYDNLYKNGTSTDTILTKANRKSNESWGDKLTVKSANVTRVCAQNINGLSIDRRGGQFENVCRVHNKVQADIFMGQEHNLDTTQMHVRSALYNATQELCK